MLTIRWARSHWSATCSPPWLAGEPDRSCGCRWRRWTGLPRHSRTGSQHLWDSPPSQWCLGKEKINKVRTSFQLHTVFKKAWQEVCLPSGSDHRRSHMGPSWGTSCFLSMVRIWSSVWMDGDKPPCTQKIYGTNTPTSSTKLMDQTEFHIRKYKIDTTRHLNTTEEFRSQYILRLTAQCHLKSRILPCHQW